MPDYQIDPHLRHDFSHPPPQRYWGDQPGHVPLGPPPWMRRVRAWFRLWRTRLRHWRRQQGFLLGQWLWQHLPHSPASERTSLHLLVLALTMIVLFQACLLVLFRPS